MRQGHLKRNLCTNVLYKSVQAVCKNNDTLVIRHCKKVCHGRYYCISLFQADGNGSIFYFQCNCQCPSFTFNFSTLQCFSLHSQGILHVLTIVTSIALNVNNREEIEQFWTLLCCCEQVLTTDFLNNTLKFFSFMLSGGDPLFLLLNNPCLLVWLQTFKDNFVIIQNSLAQINFIFYSLANYIYCHSDY